MCDRIIYLESTVLELKSSFTQTKTSLSTEIDVLRKENKRLSASLVKEQERQVNLQHQINIIRGKNDTLSSNMKLVEQKCSLLEKKILDVELTQSNLDKKMSAMSNSNEKFRLSLHEKETEISTLKEKIDKTSTKCNETTSRLNSEAMRVTNITDTRASGICNLKSKLSILSDEFKEVELNLQSCDSKADSCIKSVTDLRKRINSIEKSITQSKKASEIKTYADVTSKLVDKPSINGERLIINDKTNAKNKVASSSTDAMMTTQEAAANPERDSNDINSITHKIPVHFPSSACNPSSAAFKGVAAGKKKVSRFYIGNIDKRFASEEIIRQYLNERNITVTFVRYFDKPNKRTASAHVNVAYEDGIRVGNPDFWPDGIFTKPWLSWYKFIEEHSHRRNGYR